VHVRPRPGHEHGPGTTPSIYVRTSSQRVHSLRATSCRRPVRSFPSPAPPGWNRQRFGFPLSFAPHRHQQRTSGAGTGHRARTWNNAYDISRTSDLAYSLNACDLASHGESQVSADLGQDTSRRAKAGPRIRRGARGGSYTPPNESVCCGPTVTTAGGSTTRRALQVANSGCRICCCQRLATVPPRYSRLRSRSPRGSAGDSERRGPYSMG